MLFLAKSTSRFLIKYHALTPKTNKAPTIQLDHTVCKNLFNAKGDNKAQKSTISFRTVSGLNSIPTGFCIQAFATKIQNADNVAPTIVNHVDAR